MATMDGEIYLLRNIPLTASYEHTIDFKDRTEQLNYFLSNVKYTFTQWSYIRKERDYIIPELPMDALDDINYLIFRSSAQDRYYFAFVTDRRYVNQDATEVYFTIDVMQTYMFDYKWRPSYIKQAHVDRWTAQHKPIYSMTDEGLFYGSEFVVESAFRLEQSTKVRWLFVTMVDPASDAEAGLSVENFVPSIGYFKPVESSFAAFLIPIILDQSITNVIADDGGSVEIFSNYADFVKFMLNSALGNFIRSISLLTYNPFIIGETVQGSGLHVRFNSAVTNAFTYFKKDDGNFINLLCLSSIPEEMFKGLLASAEWDIGLENSLPTDKEWEEVKAKPLTTPRDKRFESKLLCSPYRYNLLTDWRNEPIVFKNEYMTTDKIEVNYSMALSYNAPFRFHIKDYKRDPEGRNTSLTQPIALEMPVISDAYYTYMLENKNTIQTNIQNAVINGLASTAQGAISGAAVGGAWGAVGGALTGAANAALSITANIRSENAKQADLRMKPDSVLNSVDSAFNIVDGNTAITFYRMHICCENEAILSDIFNMSGYKVNRVETPNTRSRTRFNYIQTMGANIEGKFNQNDLLKIKEIFDRGITLWHYSDKDFNYLDYSFENIERSLV